MPQDVILEVGQELAVEVPHRDVAIAECEEHLNFVQENERVRRQEVTLLDHDALAVDKVDDLQILVLLLHQ